MPIIILGLVAVLGAVLLLYYQLGPKVTLRLKGSLRAASPEDETEAASEGAEADSVSVADAAQASAASGNEKVLYVFGDGELEERSLRDDGGKANDE